MYAVDFLIVAVESAANSQLPQPSLTSPAAVILRSVYTSHCSTLQCKVVNLYAPGPYDSENTGVYPLQIDLVLTHMAPCYSLQHTSIHYTSATEIHTLVKIPINAEHQLGSSLKYNTGQS